MNDVKEMREKAVACRAQCRFDYCPGHGCFYAACGFITDPPQRMLWCPECDKECAHTVRGRVAECVVCLEPHEVNPETLQPV